MPACNDLRLGGTLAPTGISGGLSINDTAISVFDWSGLFGHPGISATPVEISGRPGGLLVGDKLGRPRLPLLNIQLTRIGPGGILVAPTAAEQLWDNTDAFLTKLSDPNGNYLEVDLPDTTSRFIHVTAEAPVEIQQPGMNRRMSVPLFSEWPYWWEGGQESTDTISGADTLVNAGTARVYDPVLVFSGDGTFTGPGGWTLTITGSTGAVTVDLGARTVTQAGLPADQLLTRNNREWGWFLPGSNSVNSSVSVVVTWRSQWG